MEREAANWRYDLLHSEEKKRAFHDGSFTTWSGERSVLHPYAARDGVTIYVSAVDADPTYDVLADKRIAPDDEAESPTVDGLGSR